MIDRDGLGQSFVWFISTGKTRTSDRRLITYHSVHLLTQYLSSSWRKISQRVVEPVPPNESFPPSQSASTGVKGLALQGVTAGTTGGLLDEETSNDEDEPDD